MFEPIHQHLLIKATVVTTFDSMKKGNLFLTTLVDRIGMKPVTLPKSAYVFEEGNEGLTGSINLATSHIAYHVWDNNKMLMMDVYSCKCFCESTILNVIEEFFDGVSEYHSITIDRSKLW